MPAKKAVEHPRPRVFISHSSREDARAQKVRGHLREALEASGRYEVLEDETSLEPGQLWRPWMNYCIEACDAAIVILSRAALKSPYVAYECHNLSHRHETSDPSLLILPVALEDVRAKDLTESNLDPAQLAKHQFVKGNLKHIVDSICKRLEKARLCELTATERRAKKLSDVLWEMDHHILQAAAARMEQWISLGSGKLHLQVAIQLLSVNLKKAVRALLVLRGHLAFDAFKAKKMNRILELFATRWVDLRCAERIWQIAMGAREPLRAFSINTEHWDIACLYIAAAGAIHDDPDGTWLSQDCLLPVGEDLEELVETVRRTLIWRLNSSEEELLKHLRILAQSGQAVVIGLSSTCLDEPALTRLRQEFPYVSFFLLMGASMATPFNPSLVEQLSPNLGDGEEDRILESREFLEISLRDRSDQGGKFL